MTDIQNRLFALQDEGYRKFHSALVPNLSPKTIIGVRTPALRALAAELYRAGNYEGFLAELPHRYYEENNLHGMLLSRMKEYDACIRALDRFLPYVDNWATCDGLNPTVFAKNRAALLADIPRWLASDAVYTIRFGVGRLMCHFLDEDFRPAYLSWVAEIQSEEYYVNMMLAWYFATALAKQYDSTIVYFEQHKLPLWVHNKAIQKAKESYRVPPERKAYLNSLKIK